MRCIVSRCVRVSSTTIANRLICRHTMINRRCGYPLHALTCLPLLPHFFLLFFWSGLLISYVFCIFYVYSKLSKRSIKTDVGGRKQRHRGKQAEGWWWEERTVKSALTRVSPAPSLGLATINHVYTINYLIYLTRGLFSRVTVFPKIIRDQASRIISGR